MATETFANFPATTVPAGASGTVSSGQADTWVVSSSAAFPAAVTGVTKFHVADTALGATSELILVTNVAGTVNATWSVIRGAESTTPVAHSPGFTVTQVIAAGWLNQVATDVLPAGGLAGQTLTYGTASTIKWAYAPVDWLNIVTAYGADPGGTVDSTAFIQNALTAAGNAGGGVVYLPAGTYKVTPPSTTVPALTVPSGVVIQGDGMGATTLLKNGNGILLDFSGPGPISETAAWNLYQGLRDLAINGNSKTGLILRLYYLQFYYENNVYIHNNADVSVDMVQCFDSRITNGLYLYGGSGSASAISGGQACTHLIRNSAAPATTLSSGISGTITALPVAALPAALPAGIVQVWNGSGQVQNFTTTGAAATATSIPVSSVAVAHTFISGNAVNGFGWSGNKTNALVMQGCHWENNISGAIWITKGVNNTQQIGPVHIMDFKCEQDAIGYNCPPIQVDPGGYDIQMRSLFFYAGGFNGGYSTPVPGIQFSPDTGVLADVNLSNGGPATLTTGITLSPAVVVYLENILANFGAAPTSGNGITVPAGICDVIGIHVIGSFTTAIATPGGQLRFGGIASSASGNVLTSNGAGALPTFQQTFTGLMEPLTSPVTSSGSPYSAAAGQYVPVDTTGGNVTVNLPHAPADKSIIGTKQVIQGGTFTTTYVATGGDVINKTGGGTQGTLSLPSQGAIVQYAAAGSIWYIYADDLPLGQLDLRYVAQSSLPLGVGSGGTGGSAVTAYAVVTGGTSSTSPFQAVSGTAATAGQVLTYQGSGSLPTWTTVSGGGSSATTAVQTTSFGAVSGTLNVSTFGAFFVTLSGAPTFKFTGASAGFETSFTLYLKQPASGTIFYTPTWPSGTVSAVQWQDSIPPQLSAVNSAVDILVFATPDGGVNWYGSLAGVNYA